MRVAQGIFVRAWDRCRWRCRGGGVVSEIGRVLVIPPTVRPGETCEVRVLAANNSPLSEFDAVQIDINGQCGPHQFLQFPATGRYGLRVAARSVTGELLDSVQAEVVAVVAR